MRQTNVTLKDVQNVYDGAEGVLWELIMGEQIHVGGFMSSMTLAEKAGIKAGQSGLDLCSALGGGCRFLVDNFKVRMCGVDATETMIRKSNERAAAGGYSERIEFKLGDVTDTPYPDDHFDFVWGEDAWCYVLDKGKLICEAVRVLKPGGTLAFTDWIEGSAGLSDPEADRINAFMKFPYMESVAGYRHLIEQAGMEIITCEELTAEFAEFVDLYLNMLSRQLTFDALKIIGNDMDLFRAMGGEMGFMKEAASAGKMGRGRFIARK